jgi:hypothetical protein
MPSRKAAAGIASLHHFCAPPAIPLFTSGEWVAWDFCIDIFRRIFWYSRVENGLPGIFFSVFFFLIFFGWKMDSKLLGVILELACNYYFCSTPDNISDMNIETYSKNFQYNLLKFTTFLLLLHPHHTLRLILIKLTFLLLLNANDAVLLILVFQAHVSRPDFLIITASTPSILIITSRATSIILSIASIILAIASIIILSIASIYLSITTNLSIAIHSPVWTPAIQRAASGTVNRPAYWAAKLIGMRLASLCSRLTILIRMRIRMLIRSLVPLLISVLLAVLAVLSVLRVRSVMSSCVVRRRSLRTRDRIVVT